MTTPSVADDDRRQRTTGIEACHVSDGKTGIRGIERCQRGQQVSEGATGVRGDDRCQRGQQVSEGATGVRGGNRSEGATGVRGDDRCQKMTDGRQVA
jgi:hypothetical protein